MRKYFEAGLISFICCIALGFALAVGNNPEKLSAGRSQPNLEEISVQAKVTNPTPKIPVFQLPSTLPALTPEQSRSQVASAFQVDDIDFPDASMDPWDSEFDSTLANFSYVAPGDRQYRIEIDPSNYGDRQAKDAQGKIVQNDILVVLHETTSSAESAIHTFLTHHPNDADQVSYHALILLDGRIVHLVPPEKRAYGAGNSEFKSDVGVESVQTNPNYPSSVNNFAYHISLETPLDAQNRAVESHSGYSLEQYDSLAWLIQQLEIEPNRVTTHRDVDRAQARSDPRSFDMGYLAALLF